ncbi:trypco2 family protein [Streptomyces sp. AN091965]|uniref:trypco2 family protein n=1 Tax=Streptomyces sp. AN091965 TaxID=2927803 RepID=UPI001F60652B|nr:trypco2 family protein [Streptomyces sp. AN091965]MCI3932040.1 hypothetical protein [Streptomyces sp. AN091965]
MADETSWAGLAEAIGAVRAELRRAEEAGRDENVRFRTGPVELEFSVDVRKEGEARAKVFVLPFGAEAKGARSTGATHRLKVTLQPVDGAGEDRVIGDHDAQGRPR